MGTTNERPGFSNISNKVALSIETLREHLTSLTGGWPRCISEQLCYQDGDEVQPLRSAAALFAWIDKHAAVSWRRGGVSKEEFYEGLLQRAERYDWASPFPHFPKVAGVHYTSKRPKAENTGALDELVGRFKPATSHDAELLKGCVMTMYWGGPRGKRPMFVFTSDAAEDKDQGCGTGKTTAAELLSRLVGGYISVRLHTSQDRVLSNFLSPTSWPKRVALADNVKTYRFSSDFIESLVTCEEINGHRLHHGFAARPNLLTWLVTVRGASFSKDMAQRGVVILLKRPKTSGKWYTETVRFIEDNRWDISADVRWHLEREAQAIKLDRWDCWGAEVLSRLAKPKEILKLLAERRGAIDEDDQDAEVVIEHVRACLGAELPKTNLDTAVVSIPSLLLTEWVRLLKRELSHRQVAQYLRQLNSPRLRYGRTKTKRFYLWTGELAKANTMVQELTYKVRTREA